MTKNMKIRTFLMISFSVILVLMTILGGVSIFYTQKMANQTINFYNQSHAVQVEVGEIRQLMTSMGSSIKDALLYKTSDKTNETTASLAANLEELTAAIQTVKENFTGDQMLLTNADQYVQMWLTANDQLRVSMEAQKYDEAQNIYFNSYIPAEKELEASVAKISESCAVISEGYYTYAKESRLTSFIIVLILLVIAVVATFVICSIITRGIMIPLRQIETAAQEMSQGNLHHQIKYEGRNEFGRLAESMRETMTTLGQYVDNIDSVLGRISSKDMTATVDMDYAGDFAPIKTSLQKILVFLNCAMLQIKESSDQVAEHANQISVNGQVLAQGSTEQAGSVQELSASIDEISEQVRQSATYTHEINKLVENVGTKLTKGNAQMSEMLTAISEINNASDQIAKIIKTIEDIAFQTNILALNAAVEAARAGAAGKGFAVVADEVRNLAAKSGAAAKSTTELIQNSIRAVDNGTRIADETAKTLEVVVEGAGQITGMVGKITISSKDQAQSITNISSAVEQISQVVSTTSATAEESAAASEELNSQAQVMRSLANTFKLTGASRTLEGYVGMPRKELKSGNTSSILSASNW